MSGSTRPCTAQYFPHGLRYARPYVTGWRCDRHTPAAEAGRPESPPGPGWPAGALIHQQHTAAEAAPDEGTTP